MRVAGGQPLGDVLRAVGRERREPSADAFARRAVHADSVLWKQENEGVADNRRLCRDPQAYLALVGFDGARSRVSEAAAERAWRRAPSFTPTCCEEPRWSASTRYGARISPISGWHKDSCTWLR